MKPPSFEYRRPSTVAEAIDLLHADPDARPLAGGQSLMPMLNLRLAAPSTLVDLQDVAGLDRIDVHDEKFVIGAMVRQLTLEEDRRVAERCPLLPAALAHVGHRPIRARGTLGGTLAHADPGAELPAALLALDGAVRAVGPAGERVIPADELFVGYYATALEPDELITEVHLPFAPPRSGWACEEYARRHGDYALCGALVQVALAPDGTIEWLRLAFIAMGDRPLRATAAEDALQSRRPSPELIERAARVAVEGLEPTDDGHTTGAHRLQLGYVLARRALATAIERACR